MTRLDGLEAAEVGERTRVLTVDGPSVSSKSSVLKVAFGELSLSADVQCEVAGDFFRGVTAGIYQEVGDDIDRVTSDPETLDRFIECVLNGRGVNQPTSPDDLDAAVIDANVSKIGQRDITQYAIQGWYDSKIEQAVRAKRSFLVLDGRNPRERIRQHIEDETVVSALDLLLNCSVSVAATRALLRASRHSEVPIDDSPEAVAIKEREIIERREMDARRKIYPYKPPLFYLDYREWETGEGLVAKSWGNAINGLPTTIRLDTTQLTLDEQSGKVRELVGAAVTHPKAK